MCPHCLVAFHEKLATIDLGKDADGHWALIQAWCPTCGRMVLVLACGEAHYVGDHLKGLNDVTTRVLVRPRGTQRPPCPEPVKREAIDIAADYAEACLVLPDSPKASAALSRRCLQALLKLKAGTTKHDLNDAIQEVLDSRQLPSYLATGLDAVRNIGNFAAHTQKSKATGEIIDVEPGEAEWNLDVLEGLFDFYFVQPDIALGKRSALNKKLAQAGKPPMK